MWSPGKKQSWVLESPLKFFLKKGTNLVLYLDQKCNSFYSAVWRGICKLLGKSDKMLGRGGRRGGEGEGRS